MCGTPRAGAGGLGYCGMGWEAVIARAAPHLWEEPCISGTRGTGAVFFSGCALRCVYCQNYGISHENLGVPVTAARLADILKALEQQGVHNIEFVTAMHFLYTVLEALDIYHPAVPLIWNSGGYERVETLKLLDGRIDIYIPDLKHASARLSALLLGAPDYFDRAGKAVAWMCGQTGLPQYDAEGLMTRGTIVRHLVLPGCTADTMRILNWIASSLPQGMPVSLMRQYTPISQCGIKGLDRRVTAREYARVVSHINSLGLPGYIQDQESASHAFTPLFDGTGV
jgi:putative pyruvate formate lyase activating enzyme